MEVLDLFELYIKNYVAPILVESSKEIDLKNGVEIDGDCGVFELQGKYDSNGEYHLPNWLSVLNGNADKERTLLIIKNINDTDEDNQMKFYELLKYRKMDTVQLPQNCVIIATCNNLKEKPINPTLYSLMAHIKL